MKSSSGKISSKTLYYLYIAGRGHLVALIIYYVSSELPSLENSWLYRHVGMYTQCFRLVFESGTNCGCNASCGSRNYREIQKPDVTILAKGAELHEKHLVEEYARYEFDEVVGRYPDNIRQDAVVPTSYGRTMKEDNSLSFRCMANGKSLVRRYISVAWFGIKIITPQPPGVISCNESFGSFCASL